MKVRLTDALASAFPDPPRGEEYWVASSDEFQHATDLVKYIRKNHGDHFCIGVAGTLSTSQLMSRRLSELSFVLI